MKKVARQWSNLALPELDVGRREEAGLPSVANGAIVLPSGDVSISECAENLFARIAEKGSMFVRSGVVVELSAGAHGKLVLEIVTPTAFRSRIEKFGPVMAWRIGNNGEKVLKQVSCSEDTAKALLASTAARKWLANISMIADCPIIVENEGGLKILQRGFHPEFGGILVICSENGRINNWHPSVCVIALKWILSEFDFLTPGDSARAFAALITPALKMGGLLKGRSPLIVCESDQSQAGKTYLQKIIAALYNEVPTMVVTRNGGVGSMEETFAQALVNGRPFILLDNFRGKMDSPYLEAFMTSSGSFPARVPYRSEVSVDPERFVVMMTSNGVETTRDMANRSCIVRIRKREGFSFRSYPEGGLLEFVKTHQSTLLDCVFSLVRAWHEKGQLRTSAVVHDFREWAQVLDWFVQDSGYGPLLMDHQQAQERVSTPTLAFVRQLGMALRASGEFGRKNTASALGSFCLVNGIEIPGCNSCEEAVVARVIGALMKKVFNSGKRYMTDSFQIVSAKVRTLRRDGGGAYDANTYEFLDLDD